jgi:hypothetical protein
VSTETALFDLPADATVIPDLAEARHLSADKRRTKHQLALLTARHHPFGRPLHADAPPADDRTAPGPRCGTCRHLISVGHHNRTYQPRPGHRRPRVVASLPSLRAGRGAGRWLTSSPEPRSCAAQSVGS